MKKFDSNLKYLIVNNYKKGVSVKSLSQQYSIPRSTIYHWIKSITFINTDSASTITYQDYTRLTQQLKKAQNIIDIKSTTEISNLSSTKERVLEVKSLITKGYSINEACEAINLSKSTFYRLSGSVDKLNSYELRAIKYTQLIKDICFEHNFSIGADKITYILKSRGYPTSQKYVSRLMRNANIENSRNNTKNYYKRLNQKEKKDLVQMKFTTHKPNQVWVSDITDLRLNNLTYKLCVIMDLYSRKIIAYKLSLVASTHLLTSCMRNAINTRDTQEGLIFHSDRGSQYVSFTFRKLIERNQFKQSFSLPSNPYNNSVVESFFANFKREEFHRAKLKSAKDLYQCVDDYIARYNEKRPHASNNYLTPNEKESNYYSTI